MFTLLLAATSATTIPFVAAQNQTKMVTTDDLYGTLVSTAAPPGYNVYGGSVFQNYVNAVSTTGSSFFSTLEVVFSKSLDRNLNKAPFSTGAAISLSLT